MKVAFLGLIGFACGGALGVYTGEALTPGGPANLGLAIGMLIGGFWLGAILLGVGGIGWGIRFRRRFGRRGPTESSRTPSESPQPQSCDHDWVDRDEILNYDPKYLRCSKCGEGRFG